jgi:hypothetical protein
MHLKKVRKQRPEAADIGPTPGAISKAEIATIAPSRHTNDVPVSRKQGMHDRLLKSQKISPAEHAWCERYACDCEIEQGARPGKPEVERVGDGANGWSFQDTQLAAQGRLRRARDNMTAQQRALVESACVKAHRVCDVAIVCGIFPGDDETMAAFQNRVGKRVEAHVTDAIKAGSAQKSAKKVA